MKDLIIRIGESENELFKKLRDEHQEKVDLLSNQIDELRNRNYSINKVTDLFGNLDDRITKF